MLSSKHGYQELGNAGRGSTRVGFNGWRNGSEILPGLTTTLRERLQMLVMAFKAHHHFAISPMYAAWRSFLPWLHVVPSHHNSTLARPHLIKPSPGKR